MSDFSDAVGRRDQVELRDALGGRDRAGSVMHLEGEFEELRDALRCRGGASLEMHWEAVIELTQRCTWSP